VVDVRIADLVAGRIASAPDPDAADDDGDDEPEPVVSPSPARPAPEPEAAPLPPASAAPVAPPSAGPLEIPPLVALRPRANYQRATPPEALRMLDSYRGLLAALAARAV